MPPGSPTSAGADPVVLDLRSRLHAIEGFAAFPSVARIDTSLQALHAHSPASTRIETIGSSRAGHPMAMLSVGKGTRHALVVAMPHPNEPIGALALLRLAELLTSDPALLAQLGLVWHFVGCADPDGTRLNEEWFPGTYDMATYARHLYRPPFEEQFEWTFHRPGLAQPGLAPTPESTAVARVIDTLRPELMISIHNAERGGLYAYVTEPEPALAATMASIRQTSGIPLELGQVEEDGEGLSPGLIHAPGNVVGGPMLCSTDYAAQYGTFGLTIEPPLWADPRAEDTRRVEASRAELAQRYQDHRRDLGTRLTQWSTSIEAELRLDSPRRRALSSLTDSVTADGDWPPVPAGQQSADEAFAASLDNALAVERIRGAGQTLSLLAESGSYARALSHVREDANACLSAWVAEASTSPATFVGLTTAIQGPVGLALGLADAATRT